MAGAADGSGAGAALPELGARPASFDSVMGVSLSEVLIESIPFRLFVIGHIRCTPLADHGRHLLAGHQAVENSVGPERVIGGGRVAHRHPASSTHRTQDRR